jgi:acyl-CoA reductase-like NAD-dependent aldehyde dehydrogenase
LSLAVGAPPSSGGRTLHAHVRSRRAKPGSARERKAVLGGRLMTDRLPVRKTYKLFIGGAFPRSESGRTYHAEGQNVARASRKDVRDAVKAARGAFPKWAGMTAYNRGQVLYRLAEMVESRTSEFAALCSGREEVERSIDRIVWYAGWADKLPQVLGGSNPVAGPYFNFTVTEPTGVVAILAPSEPALLGLVSRVAPALVGGNVVVAVASEDRPLAAIELAEAVATSDVPGGAVNILTGQTAELAPWLASHMDVNAIDVAGADGLVADIERAAADNVKRVVAGRADVQSPWEIASFLELKTVWHPVGT